MFFNQEWLGRIAACSYSRVACLAGRPVDGATLQDLVRKKIENPHERTQLLLFAGRNPQLWQWLEDDSVVDVLRLGLQGETTGET